MNFIKPNVEIITEPDMFKRIEIAARTCYASCDRISDGSAEKMVKMLIKRGHDSPLEHSNIVIQFDTPSFNMLDELLGAYTYITGLPHFIRVSSINPIICSGNLRAWRSLAKEFPDEPILCRLFKNHPGFFDIPMSTWSDDGMSYGIIDEPVDDPRHQIVTARFTCDRGVTHELVRHRCLSFSQSSTRYINYQDGLTVVEPWWWPQEQEDTDTAFIRSALEPAEHAYSYLIKSGSSPQKARCVLPNMLMAEIVTTGTVEQWQKYVLPLRLSKAAHPDIRKLMEMFCEKMGWDPNNFRKGE